MPMYASQRTCHGDISSGLPVAKGNVLGVRADFAAQEAVLTRLQGKHFAIMRGVDALGVISRRICPQ